MPSSVIHGMLYSPARKTLDIVFRGSRRAYRYYDVLPEEWRAFKRAPSKGTYLNAQFKGRHPRVDKIEGLNSTVAGALFASAATLASAGAANDVPDENVWGFYEGSVLT